MSRSSRKAFWSSTVTSHWRWAAGVSGPRTMDRSAVYPAKNRVGVAADSSAVNAFMAGRSWMPLVSSNVKPPVPTCPRKAACPNTNDASRMFDWTCTELRA